MSRAPPPGAPSGVVLASAVLAWGSPAATALVAALGGLAAGIVLVAACVYCCSRRRKVVGDSEAPPLALTSEFGMLVSV